MSIGVEELPKFLQLLSKHGGLLTDIYNDGGIEITDDNRSAIHDLSNVRAIIPYRAGAFRLSRIMRALFDEQTRRQKGYEVGGNIGALIAQMISLQKEYMIAAGEGRIDDQERHARDLADTIFEIQDVVSDDLSKFQRITISKFSNVKTLAEKKRQNEHYLKRSKELQSALNNLTAPEVIEVFDSPLAEDLGVIYHENISSKRSEWTSQIISIYNILREYYFKLRRIDPRKERLLFFSQQLEKRSNADIENTLFTAQNLPWMRQHQPMKTVPFPDLVSYEGRQSLLEVIQRLKPMEERKTKERTAGVRVQDDDDLVYQEDASSEELALEELLESAKGTTEWISTRQWGEENNYDIECWMQEVLYWTTSEIDDDWKVKFIESGHPNPKKGNIPISDVLLCPSPS